MTFVIALSLATVAAPAGASTRIGSTCGADSDASNYVVADSATGTALSGGVVTKWGLNSLSGATYYSANLLVLSPNGTPNGYSVASVTAALPVKLGANAIASRIPIKPGQVIGIWGEAAALTCSGGSTTARAFAAPTLPAAGATLPPALAISNVPALFADIESDVDGDGFGDESQDLCPQSAQLQIACPTPVLTARTISTRKAFKARVSADVAATIAASATLKLPAKKKKKAKILTLKSKRINAIGGVKTELTIKYPKTLKTALAALSKKKSLKLKVSITAAGLLSNDVEKITVKLRGTK